MSAGFLLDTSVISLMAPGKPALKAGLARWLRANTDRLYISAITVAEIEQGISKLRRSGARERADALALWLDVLIANGAERVLPLDARSGRAAGDLSDRAFALGRHPGFPDVAIAAIAVVHDLLLLTRNGRHFAPLGISFADPVEALPEA